MLVDRSSVEYFIDEGRHVHSHRVFPFPGDDHIRLFVNDGEATFRALTIRELKV
ncbi:GH32 C-terminal domain-containing protein [Kribbella pratensis]|uniref:GH32 C-terminal domain-containing protein n=1 Tax=Kribbella pratensis TaxID=2512112 RepID=UPI0035CAEFA4